MDGLGEALRTTGEGWREGAGVRWSMLDWMDGDRRGGRQRQLQRRPGQRRQQRWRLRGGRRRRRGGGVGVVARGDVGSGCASGRVQSESRSRKVGRVSRGRGVAVGGETQEEGSGASREGGFGTRRERGVRVGARREERGVAFHLADGVLRERGSDGDRNSDGEGDRTGRGPAATASAAGTASAASATRTATTTATARTGQRRRRQ